MDKIIFQLEQLTCPSCIKKIETALKQVDGVDEAYVFFKSCKAKVEYNRHKVNSDQLKAVIEGLGFAVI